MIDELPIPLAVVTFDPKRLRFQVQNNIQNEIEMYLIPLKTEFDENHNCKVCMNGHRHNHMEIHL